MKRIAFVVEKVAKNRATFVISEKLFKVINQKLGKNSPNLVTLIQIYE
jgi:hypothetical protein